MTEETEQQQDMREVMALQVVLEQGRAQVAEALQ
jgi:hypothetical protein